MAIYDTSNTLDNSIFLKAKLDKNMVGSNYYIENLQAKRDKDWEYRYNVVDIEEELNKQVSYTNEDACYTPIEAVITNVKSDKGQDLGTDFAHIAFRNLKHKCNVGSRYRFSLDFPNMKEMTEEDKHYNTSIWLTINKSPIKAGNSCTVRRCNTSLVFVGSPTKSNDYITEVHHEPCIFETEMKYTQVYSNMVMPVPQAEIYITMQLNYFTNCIKINDRFIFSTRDYNVDANNMAFKVKAVVKYATDRTFVKDYNDGEDISDEIEHTTLIIVGLDKDAISPNDDIGNRIACDAPIYKTIDIAPTYKYYIEMEEPSVQRILLNATEEYEVNLHYNNDIVNGIDFDFECKLNGIIEKNWGNYYEFIKTGKNSFSIHNLKSCNRGCLEVKASCKAPNNTNKDREVIEQSYEIELGGFY